MLFLVILLRTIYFSFKILFLRVFSYVYFYNICNIRNPLSWDIKNIRHPALFWYCSVKQYHKTLLTSFFHCLTRLLALRVIRQCGLFNVTYQNGALSSSLLIVNSLISLTVHEKGKGSRLVDYVLQIVIVTYQYLHIRYIQRLQLLFQARFLYTSL